MPGRQGEGVPLWDQPRQQQQQPQKNINLIDWSYFIFWFNILIYSLQILDFRWCSAAVSCMHPNQFQPNNLLKIWLFYRLDWTRKKELRSKHVRVCPACGHFIFTHCALLIGTKRYEWNGHCWTTELWHFFSLHKTIEYTAISNSWMLNNIIHRSMCFLKSLPSTQCVRVFSSNDGGGGGVGITKLHVNVARYFVCSCVCPWHCHR